MSKFVDTIRSTWSELEPVIELFTYLLIAKLISYMFGISYLWAITIVYVYFILNLARIAAEILRKKFR
jgi:prepilin signal peptidase PulO-like enzyme (type II secretory pathway)